MTGSRAHKILVVDDDQVMLTTVSHLMRKQGFEVLQARSGAETIAQVEQHHPDLVLLDIRLPDINGVDVLKRLRGDHRFDDIFIVHLSAQTGPAEKKFEGLDLGADGYITQPVENDELVARVRAFLRHKRTLDELRESERRYRVLFESNPEPMWIYDVATSQMVAVNHSALHEYGYSREEFLKLRVTDLEDGAAKKETFDLPRNCFGSCTHRTKSGTKREVVTNEQEIVWGGEKCRVVLAHDVTERNRMDREKTAQLERMEREYRSLGRLGEERKRDDGDTTLRTRALGARDGLARRYEGVLHEALESRVYKTDKDVSTEVRALAAELFGLKATARDVIEIHCATMRKVAPVPETPKAQAMIETGRITLVELLGYLLGAYRQICSREKTDGEQR